MELRNFAAGGDFAFAANYGDRERLAILINLPRANAPPASR